MPLKEISWAVIISGSLTRGVEKCLRGCKNEAGTCKFDSMIKHETNRSSLMHVLTDDKEIFKNLN